MRVRASAFTWIVRLLWLSLPLTLGDLVQAVLDDRSGSVRVTAVVLALGLWAGGLLATLVPSPATLTTLRVLAPLPLVVGVWAAIDRAPSPLGWIGLVCAGVALVLSLSAELGHDFVDAASYGDERRFALRPPMPLLLGPIELTWALTALPLPAGILLLGAGAWVAGVLLTAVGAATAWFGGRTLDRLARRWLVFVPAGLTLVDHLAVVDPVLFRRRDVTRFGPAPASTTATDLTAAASGLIVQIDVDPPVSLLPVVARGATEATTASSVLLAPSRPGAVLDHADRRSLAVQRG